MTPVTETRGKQWTIAAGIAALVGPVCAVLPYTDYLPPDLHRCLCLHGRIEVSQAESSTVV